MTGFPNGSVPLYRSRPLLLAGGVGVLALGTIGFVPLFGGPGYEAALAAGLLLPSLAAAAVAVDCSRHQGRPIEGLSRGISAGASLGAVGLVVVLAHGLRVGFCDLAGGTELFLLGPFAGTVLGGVWGCVIGALFVDAGKLKLSLLGILGPLFAIGISLWRFYTSPMVFAFDPFFGVFAGPLYDTVVDVNQRLLSYRLGSLMTLLAVVCLAFQLKRLKPLTFRDEPSGLLAVAGGIFVLASLVHIASGDRLGHYSTAASIRATLDRQESYGRCDVLFSGGVSRGDAALLARECEAHLQQIEQYFARRFDDRVGVYLFEHADQKGRLMGARNTYIAKPWRKEIYLQARGFPHPVLGHELAHVVSGNFSQGPFKVAGGAWGWVPDPGRIEGFAVAASPDPDDDLSPEEWAKAMKELGILPRLSSIFQLGFLTRNSSMAYTVAGAFISFLHGRYGPGALREWYAGEKLQTVFGKNLVQLEREWLDSLETRRLDRRMRLAAKARFDRPSIFGRRCPHEVDQALQRANARLHSGDPEAAQHFFERARELDRDSVEARRGLAICALRRGKVDLAKKKLIELRADARLTALSRAFLTEQLGDIHFLEGKRKLALKEYQRALEVIGTFDHIRSLEVKSKATSPVAVKATLGLLVGDAELGPHFGEAAAWLGRWSEREPERGTPDYLLGKNFYNQGRFPEARRRLDEALSRELPQSLRSEALRVRVILACRESDQRKGSELARTFIKEARLPKARRASVLRFLERCGFVSPSDLTREPLR